MHKRSVWLELLGVEGSVVEDVECGDGVVAVAVRLGRKHAQRCPECGRRCPGYDQASKAREWRALDLGVLRGVVRLVVRRIQCPEHGVLAEAIPWARRGSSFTRAFEDTVAWLAARTSKTCVAELMRVSWATVGNILERVCGEAQARAAFPAVRRIGIDEVSYRRGHRYLTVVVDHDTGRLLFAQPGKDAAALEAFFVKIGPGGCQAIEQVSMDAASHWHAVVAQHCPGAKVCMDPFHVVQWATRAVDKVRRRLWQALRKGGDDESAASMKGLRFALLKNPENLTPGQSASLSAVQKLNAPLYRAYLLKEQLREVFRLPVNDGIKLLDKWLAWASRCRIPEFTAVAASVRDKLGAIHDALHLGLSNARVESLNTRMQLLTRTAFGFHSAQALIALAFLKLGGLCPPLPRAQATHSR